MLNELWLTEDNQKEQRFNDFKVYIENSFVHRVFNRPPHNAYENFKNIDVNGLNAFTLKVSVAKLRSNKP